MNLKKIALLVVLFSLTLFVLAFTYNIPVAYVPYGASKFEYVVSYTVFMLAEVSALSFLFVYMIKKSNLEFHLKISQMFI